MLGNRAMMDAAGIADVAPERGRTPPRRRRPSSSSRLDRKLAGLLGVADPIKSSTPEAVKQLHAAGVRIVMLTGDSRATAEAVARRSASTRSMPRSCRKQKVEAVRRLQGEGRVVAMAGDGVNDAPALAAADVGIAMGTGTDVAMESAGVTLVKGDLRGIARARQPQPRHDAGHPPEPLPGLRLQPVGVPIAAGLLYPFFGLLLSPMIAAAAMSLSSVSVIANALRLRYTDV